MLFVLALASRCRVVLHAEGEDRLSLMSAKVEETLLASTLEIQVPGPGAKREGSYFESNGPLRTLKINLDLLNWQAHRKKKRGDYDGARELFKKCTELDPVDGRAWLALSKDAEARDPRRAARYLLRALRHDPTNAHVRQAYGVLLERSGQRSRALSHYEQALKHNPKHAASWIAKARLLDKPFRTRLEDGKYAVTSPKDDNTLSEARRCYENAVAAEPKNYHALVSAATFEARCGRLDAARSLFKRAIGANPRNAASYSAWAQVEDRPEEARRLYRKAHQAHKSNTRSLKNWAVFELKQRNATGAAWVLEQASAVRKGKGRKNACDDGDVFAMLGAVHWKHGADTETARAFFRRAIALDQTLAKAYLLWAELEFAEDRPDAARRILQHGIWGCTTGIVDPKRLVELWRAAAKVEARTYPRTTESIAAARLAFRKALDTADVTYHDQATLVASVFRDWARFESKFTDSENVSPRDVLEAAVRMLPKDASLKAQLRTLTL